MSLWAAFFTNAIFAGLGAAGLFLTQGVSLMNTVADLTTKVADLKTALAAHVVKDADAAAKIVDLQTQLDAFKNDAAAIDSAATDIASVSAVLNPVASPAA